MNRSLRPKTRFAVLLILNTPQRFAAPIKAEYAVCKEVVEKQKLMLA